MYLITNDIYGNNITFDNNLCNDTHINIRKLIFKMHCTQVTDIIWWTLKFFWLSIYVGFSTSSFSCSCTIPTHYK